MDDRQGLTAVITGGAQGIGKAIAYRFLKKAFNVVVADVDQEALDSFRDECDSSDRLLPVLCDIAREREVQDLMTEAIEAYQRIDVLINNAAVSNRKPLTDLTLVEWQRVIDVNLTGAFICSKYAAPFLKRSQGNIINIASTRALMSEPNTEAYSASKGGIVALTHALAMSLGPEIRVNCISPGWIETGDWKKPSHRYTPDHSRQDKEQHPAGRVGNPDDIASLVEYLVSDKSGFITATNILVDGGMTRKMMYVD